MNGQTNNVVTCEILKSLHIQAQEQSKGVFRIDTSQGAVMYYSTSAKWQHRGRTTSGTLAEFREWLKRRHFL